MARSELTPKELYDRKIISKNIRRYAEINNKTQTDISKDLKIPKSTLSGYFNATSTPSPGNIQKLADYFGVKKSDLDPRFIQPSNVIPIKRTQTIPILGTIACGEPVLAEENIEDYIAFPNELTPSGESFFLKCKGDSMEPVIQDGSLVLIRQQEDVENGEIAAVLLYESNEATLKRIRKINGTLLLEAINEEYEPYLVTEDNPAKIIGKAMKTINDL